MVAVALIPLQMMLLYNVYISGFIMCVQMLIVLLRSAVAVASASLIVFGIPKYSALRAIVLVIIQSTVVQNTVDRGLRCSKSQGNYRCWGEP